MGDDWNFEYDSMIDTITLDTWEDGIPSITIGNFLDMGDLPIDIKQKLEKMGYEEDRIPF